jgi:ankyrin repeat protein
VVAAVTRQDSAALGRALAAGAPVPAQAVVSAGRLAWLPGLKALHRHGADLNASFRNYRALHALIQEKPHAGLPADILTADAIRRRAHVIGWLVERGADPEGFGAWPQARTLVVASFTGERAYVDALLAAGATKSVFVAAALGEARAVARAIEKAPGAATARDGGRLTALQCAAGSRLGARDPKTARGLLDVARCLLAAGADVNATTESWGHEVAASYFVIRSGQSEMLGDLLAAGMNPTEAVSTAAWENRGDLVDLLISHGADLDRARDHGRPILNELIRWGQFAPARMLLARGASPNVVDRAGWTALHQAASRGNVRMVEDLIKAGADTTATDSAGRTPLDVARAKPLLALLRKLRTT